jgi:hypothetical protein
MLLGYADAPPSCQLRDQVTLVSGRFGGICTSFFFSFFFFSETGVGKQGQGGVAPPSAGRKRPETMALRANDACS